MRHREFAGLAIGPIQVPVLLRMPRKTGGLWMCDVLRSTGLSITDLTLAP
jgi:hypothetical protein